jgi:hypothetical protein
LKKLIIVSVVLLLISFPAVMAQTGGLRISPQWPVMVESPADFQVWAQSADSYDVNVLLVTTEECYNGFPDPPTSAVTVEYPAGSLTVGILKTAFTGVTLNSEIVPPTGTTPGAGYTVASLKDHLDYGLSTPLGPDDMIYWAIAPLAHPDFDPLTTTPLNITVTVDSDNTRMLVYLLGKSEDGATLFDMNVPPTNPGFVVPEIAFGSIMAAATMFTALGLFAYKKKHTPKQ